MYVYLYFTIIIIILLFYGFKSEHWYIPVNGYDIKDHNDGYAGSSQVPAIDFYLCGNREYRVHYLGDDPLHWSENFSNCEPVGIGRVIDGICVYGNKSYKGRLYRGDNWMGIIKGCNISDIDGYVGKLGTPLACVAINGKDSYRIGYLDEATEIKSSNPKNASDRIVKSLFGENIINEANYDNEYELDLSSDIKKSNLFIVKIQLFSDTNIDLDGNEIKFIFENKDIIFTNWGIQDINNLMNNKLNNIINFDINLERQTFEKIIANDIIHGILVIHSFYEEGRIQMDIGSKIDKDFQAYRGGIRLNLILNNSENFIELIKKIIKLISVYIDTENSQVILDKIKEFNNINQLGEITKLISPYDALLTQIICLYILKKD